MKRAELGDKVQVPFDGKIGRIEILRAKQVIANSIRRMKPLRSMMNLKTKEGTIIHGVDS